MIKNITLSEINFELATKDEPALKYVKGTKEIWGPWLLVTDGITKKELFTGAGYDWSKIDTAVPQSFFDERLTYYERTKCLRDHPQNYVWSYELKHLFGEPLHVNDAWGNLRVRLATKLEDEYLAQLAEGDIQCNQ